MCHKQGYWKFRLCKNRDCQWYFNRRAALQDAKRRFHRKLWRRVVKGKGRFHRDIENAMKKTKWRRLPTRKMRVCKVYQIIRAMMTELAGGMNAPDPAVLTRIPQTPPLSTLPKHMPKKERAFQNRDQGSWHLATKKAKEKYQGKYNVAPWKQQQRTPRGPNKNTGSLKKALEARGVWTLKNKGKHRPQWPAYKKL